MVSKFSDVAVGLSEDKLGFRDYADGVIATLESLSKEDTPFTIGIFGSWGSGKTSFMQIMQELLQDRGYETIFFKSWEYGNEEKPWIPFMIKVVDNLFEKKIDKKELIRNIFLFSTDLVLQTYSQGRISTGSVLNVFRRSGKTSPFKEWSEEDANIVIERVTKIKEFKDKIKERAEESPKGKIIIFIDDLDRIPEKIVDFLNSLKTFLDISGCIFVLGCDYKILDSALKQKYKGAIYEDYFDKIVQTEFYIPKISMRAIKNYLQFLTGWDDKEIDACTQLVIHSIGGNPRKIKRVVNATMLIKSVFEKRLGTFLQAFERPKPGVSIGQGREGKEGAPEEPMALKREITKSFTPAEVFDLLFDKNVLFKLVCMREQWFTYYEKILIDEEKQQDLFSTTEEQGYKSKEDLAAIKFMKEDSPVFQVLEDLKTYLTLLEISSPEAGMSIEYAKPENLPIELFNRYMMFERINKGKVEETIIKEKINQMDWESSLGSYNFFIWVISAFGYDNLLKCLFENEEKLMQIAKKIKDSMDSKATRMLLNSVRVINKEKARGLLKETSDTYAEKIKDSTDSSAIGKLLENVFMIDAETARGLVRETKHTYAEKIKDSADPGAIGTLLSNVLWIDKNTASELLRETKDSYVDKIRDSADAGAIGTLLGGVWEIDDMTASDYDTARELLSETKDTYAEKIIASTDPEAIGVLLGNVRLIDERTAGELLNRTMDTFADKIIASTDPGAIGQLLRSVKDIKEETETARGLLKETKDTYAEKISDSTNLLGIGVLLNSVRKVDEETARRLLNETKDSLLGKMRASTNTVIKELLLDSVREIDEETAKWLEKEIKLKSE
uniref:KAP NTPase domain-containing protein n=1 Tax=Candidatus Methanophaga sp. ANME-1 ERB7 TaxID=2759913 RepID=A0A7G9Z724_9EURY|nr:hypothetical protein GMDKCDLI_00037 [Methanosarcinales archaeon ANME-1 ERB7]